MRGQSTAVTTATDPASMETCELCCFWLSPEGKSTHVKMGSSHSIVARNVLLDETGGRGLDAKGFLHVSYGNTYFGVPGAAPTQAQLDRYFDLTTELLRRRPHSADGAKMQRWLTIQQEGATS